jgi:putative ABC transport system permease protein
MRFADVLGLALSALYQQKVRSLLTILGVVFGSFVLVASLSVTTGVQKTVVEAYGRFHELRRMIVYPAFQEKASATPRKVDLVGNGDPERRERLERELRRRMPLEREPKVRLTPNEIQFLRSLPHVRSVVPDFRQQAWVVLGKKSEQVTIASAANDEENVVRRIIAGSPFPSPDCRSVLVSEYLLYQLGMTKDADLRNAPGRKLRVELREGDLPPAFLLTLMFNHAPDKLEAGDERLLAKVIDILPETLRNLNLPPEDRARLSRLLPHVSPRKSKKVLAEELTIQGVFRAMDGKDDRGIESWRYEFVDVILPTKTAEELSFRMPHYGKNGLDRVIVEVDELDNVHGVIDQLRARGYEENSFLKYIEREQFIFLMVFVGMTMVAVVALAVAALGITNTMLMSVLERIREIGVMKAVGARAGHIQLIFLVEGALIGLVGGMAGVVLAWSASFPGDRWVRSLVARRLSFEMKESVFNFGPWLVLGVPFFACLVTTLAAFYPARRAVRIDTVQALRHD